MQSPFLLSPTLFVPHTPQFLLIINNNQFKCNFTKSYSFKVVSCFCLICMCPTCSCSVITGRAIMQIVVLRCSGSHICLTSERSPGRRHQSLWNSIRKDIQCKICRLKHAETCWRTLVNKQKSKNRLCM